MSLVSLNGDIIDKDQVKFYDLERFRVADACFESILFVNGEIPLINYHQERLNRACAMFFFQESIIDLAHIKMLLEQNNLATDKARIRYSLIRKSGKNYEPFGEEVQVLIEVEELHEIFKNIPKLAYFRESFKSRQAISSFKSSNALIYVLAKQFAKAKQLDDILICNDQGNWIEASASNVFIIKDGVIYTSSDDSGCVLGVCRAFLKNFLDVKLVSLNEKAIEEADEIFLTNGVQLIQSVSNLDNKALSRAETIKIIKQVSDKLKI